MKNMPRMPKNNETKERENRKEGCALRQKGIG
jgi:hypothetical protein